MYSTYSISLLWIRDVIFIEILIFEIYNSFYHDSDCVFQDDFYKGFGYSLFNLRIQ